MNCNAMHWHELKWLFVRVRYCLVAVVLAVVVVAMSQRARQLHRYMPWTHGLKISSGERMVSPEATTCSSAFLPAAKTLAAFLAGRFLGCLPERGAKLPAQPALSGRSRHPLSGPSRRRRSVRRDSEGTCPRPAPPPVRPVQPAPGNTSVVDNETHRGARATT